MGKSRIDIAVENHKNGYNCAQAVACAYSDLVGIDEATVFKMSEGFGAGIAGTGGICGSVSAMVMLAGLLNSSGKAGGGTKGATYKLSKKLIEEFESMNTTSLCDVLKGKNGQGVIRSCTGCVEDCSAIIEKVLFNEDIVNKDIASNNVEVDNGKY